MVTSCVQTLARMSQGLLSWGKSQAKLGPGIGQTRPMLAESGRSWTRLARIWRSWPTWKPNSGPGAALEQLLSNVCATWKQLGSSFEARQVRRGKTNIRGETILPPGKVAHICRIRARFGRRRIKSGHARARCSRCFQTPGQTCSNSDQSWPKAPSWVWSIPGHFSSAFTLSPPLYRRFGSSKGHAESYYSCRGIV